MTEARKTKNNIFIPLHFRNFSFLHYIIIMFNPTKYISQTKKKIIVKRFVVIEFLYTEKFFNDEFLIKNIFLQGSSIWNGEMITYEKRKLYKTLFTFYPYFSNFSYDRWNIFTDNNNTQCFFPLAWCYFWNWKYIFKKNRHV